MYYVISTQFGELLRSSETQPVAKEEADEWQEDITIVEGEPIASHKYDENETPVDDRSEHLPIDAPPKNDAQKKHEATTSPEDYLKNIYL